MNKKIGERNQKQTNLFASIALHQVRERYEAILVQLVGHQSQQHVRPLISHSLLELLGGLLWHHLFGLL